MSMRTPAFMLALAALATIGTGYGVHRWLDLEGKSPQRENASPQVHRTVTQLPSFAFPDLAGAERSSQEWLGKVLIVNFWATWCPPCLKEIPTFVEMQEKYGAEGLQFVGVAIDDPDEVRQFVETNAVNYPILLGEADAIELSLLMGNRFSGLPFTAMFDRTGKLFYVKAGELSLTTLQDQAVPLL